jgi:hypothetical protein
MEGADLIKQGFCVSVIINRKIGVRAGSELRELGIHHKMYEVGSSIFVSV